MCGRSSENDTHQKIPYARTDAHEKQMDPRYYVGLVLFLNINNPKA
jgi:hypothetical protein